MADGYNHLRGIVPRQVVQHVTAGITGADDQHTLVVQLCDIAQVSGMDQVPGEMIPPLPAGDMRDTVTPGGKDDMIALMNLLSGRHAPTRPVVLNTGHRNTEPDWHTKIVGVAFEIVHNRVTAHEGTVRGRYFASGQPGKMPMNIQSQLRMARTPRFADTVAGFKYRYRNTALCKLVRGSEAGKSCANHDDAVC